MSTHRLIVEFASEEDLSQFKHLSTAPVDRLDAIFISEIMLRATIKPDDSGELEQALELFIPAAAELERQAVIVSSRPGAQEPMLSNAATVCRLAIDQARSALANHARKDGGK